MTLLQRPETPTRPSGGGPVRRPLTGGLTITRAAQLFTAAVAGLACVLLGAAVTAVPTVLGWVADERSTLTFWQSLGVSVDIWALAHRARISTPDLDLVLAPLLLTAVPVVLCWLAARHVVLGRPESSQSTKVGGWRAAWQGIGGTDATVFVLGYLLSALALAHTASFGPAPVSLPSMLPGALLVPLTALGLTWWGEHRSEQHHTVDQALRWLGDRTPAVVRRAVAPAFEVLVGLAAVCFLLVLGLVLMRGERILTLYEALDAGIVGTTVLTLAQLAALPNLMVWALGWMTGAGVTVGTVHVGWAESTPGDLPMIPMLGALPEPGSLPPGLWVMALVPVAAGAWLGYRCAAAAPRLATWLNKATITLASSALIFLAVLLLGWLATGSITPGLLGTIGVVPWEVALLLFAQTLGGGLVVVTVLHLVRRRL